MVDIRARNALKGPWARRNGARGATYRYLPFPRCEAFLTAQISRL